MKYLQVHVITADTLFAKNTVKFTSYYVDVPTKCETFIVEPPYVDISPILPRDIFLCPKGDHLLSYCDQVKCNS